MYGSLCEAWPMVWCGDISGINPEVTGHAHQAASEVLWEATGRRFGNCPVDVRPCRQDCFQDPWNTRWPSPALVDGQWYNIACGRCIGDCSCTATSDVLLPDPVWEIENVTVDGVSLPTSGWALYDGQRLVRTDGVDWPLCQRWDRTSGEGVWTIRARFGAPVPGLGKQAVGILTLELAKLCCGMACNLPPSVTSVTRQGVSMQRLDASHLLNDGLTGLYIPDQFIRTYNPHRIPDRARAFSPDVFYTRGVM